MSEDNQPQQKRKRLDTIPTNISSYAVPRKQHCREDYFRIVEDIMYPTKICTSYGFNPSENKYPIHSITSLGFLLSPLRKPTILEKWNPYEVALFESSIFLYGKVFNQIQKVIKTKTTKEVIEFYYEWKKSAHYQLWKKSHLADDRDTPTVLVEE